jgi:cold shock CspA family protein
MAMGAVKVWLGDKGYGFITEDDGDDVFVHAKSLPPGIKQLSVGTRVRFEKKQTDRGVQAFSVVLGAFESVDDEEDFADVLTEAEFIKELRGILPPLREIHKQAILDLARNHGWAVDD